MNGPIPPPETTQAWSTRKTAVVVAIVMVIAVALGVLLLTLNTDAQWARVTATVLAAVIAVGAGCLVAYVVMRLFRRAPPTESYDRARFNLFRSSLDGVSLGLGLEAPGLVVLNELFPDSFVTRVGGKRVVAISPPLLGLDLTNQEVEAIMAVGLANILSLRTEHSRPDIHQQLQVDSDITDQVSSFTSDKSTALYCKVVLRSDTLATRITGQPGALQSAIVKVIEALEKAPKPLFNSLEKVLVQPPGFGGRSDLNEELTRLRLENLERMKAGKRPAFSELRDGKPVVEPKGWE